mgnify:FL=1
MRLRKCNKCSEWSSVEDWGYGCPSCGHGNGREVSYSEFPGVLVMPDIQPYQSQLDGSIVKSRSHHRQHLRQHNAVEVGNETAYLTTPHKIPDTSPQKRQELLRAQFNAIDNKTFKQFLKRDIDNVKWNSRED